MRWFWDYAHYNFPHQLTLGCRPTLAGWGPKSEGSPLSMAKGLRPRKLS